MWHPIIAQPTTDDAMTTVPPFSLERPRYDQSQFLERARHFFELTNPRTLLTTDAELKSAKGLLQQFRDGTLPPGTTDAQLWEARKLKEAVVHPDTGEQIFPLFRFSAFAPMNILIVPTMMMPGVIASPLKTIGVHWFNQSYNGAVNYANRNAGSSVTNDTLMKAYAGAVGASVSIALGATAITKKVATMGKPALATAVRATLPFTAVVAAGSLNVALIRQSELTDGVQIMDHEGTVHGQSVVAGKQGIGKCCVARGLWNFPIMVIPPLIMTQLGKLPALASPRAKMLAEVAVVTCLLFVAVPPALGAFPQQDEISASELEPQFQSKVDSNGKQIETFFFNKGL